MPAPARQGKRSGVRCSRPAPAVSLEHLTNYPGWYSGRTVNISPKVHVGRTAEVRDVATPVAGVSGAHEGDHLCQTGQLFFDDAFSDEVYATAQAYAGRNDVRRLGNDEGILPITWTNRASFVVLAPLAVGSPESGLLGTITIGRDSSATSEPASDTGGPNGPWPGGEGRQ